MDYAIDQLSERSGLFGNGVCLEFALTLFAFDIISFALAFCRQHDIFDLQNLIKTDLFDISALGSVLKYFDASFLRDFSISLPMAPNVSNAKGIKM